MQVDQLSCLLVTNSTQPFFFNDYLDMFKNFCSIYTVKIIRIGTLKIIIIATVWVFIAVMQHIDAFELADV